MTQIERIYADSIPGHYGFDVSARIRLNPDFSAFYYAFELRQPEAERNRLRRTV